jgi:hypothetical protein
LFTLNKYFSYNLIKEVTKIFMNINSIYSRLQNDFNFHAVCAGRKNLPEKNLCFPLHGYLPKPAESAKASINKNYRKLKKIGKVSLSNSPFIPLHFQEKEERGEKEWKAFLKQGAAAYEKLLIDLKFEEAAKNYHRELTASKAENPLTYHKVEVKGVARPSRPGLGRVVTFPSVFGRRLLRG